MEDDEEWEYEYDDTESEDIYFTLDLTTHVPDAVPLTKLSRNGKRAPRESTVNEGTRGGEGTAAVQPYSTIQNPLRAPSREGDMDTTAAPGQLQVLDLHGTQPLVKFDDKVYSCYWHTDLGTQFYVSRPGVSKEALRPGHAVDVIGVSQARLLGKPVTLRKRPGGNENAARATAPASEETAVNHGSAPAASNLSSLRPGQQLVIPRDMIKNPEMEAQASFFERLSAIKLKKGENDIIPVGGVRHYTRPANTEQTREHSTAAPEVEEHGSSQIPQDLPPPPPPPTATMRKRLSYAEMGKETQADKAKRRKEAAGLASSSSKQAVSRSSNATGPSSVPYVAPSLASPSSGDRVATNQATPTVQYSVPDITPAPISSAPMTAGMYHPPAPRAIPWHALPAPSGTPAQTASMADMLRLTGPSPSHRPPQS